MEKSTVLLLSVALVGSIFIAFASGEAYGYNKSRVMVPGDAVAFDANGNFFGPGESAPEGAKCEYLNGTISFPVGNQYVQIDVNLEPHDAKKIGPGFMNKLMYFNYTAATGGDVYEAIPSVSQFYDISGWSSSFVVEKR